MNKVNGGCRFWWALVLAVSFSANANAQGVELLAENEMGSVDVFAGDVLNILGATAAGEVLPDVESTPPPIERTTGEESAINAGMLLAARELSLRPRDLRDDVDAATLVFPAREVPLTIERNVASPGPTAGGASFRILPGERNIEGQIEPQPGDAPDGLRTIQHTRVDEVRISDVSFPQGGAGLEGQTIVISGLEITVNALITER